MQHCGSAQPEIAAQKSIIGFNNLFIGSGPLSGPGYYAVQLLEHLLCLPDERVARHRIRVFAQEGTAHHYSQRVRDVTTWIPVRGRLSRVCYEQLALPFRARRAGIDLLFSPGFVSPLWGAPRMVATIHDMYYRIIPEAVEPFQLKYWKAMIPLTSRVCDLLLTVSGSSARDIEHFLPAAQGKIRTIPLASRFGRPEPFAGPPQREGIPYVLMIANLTPNKNVACVVEAVARLRQQGQEIEFKHIGKDHRGELDAAIRRFDMAEYAKSIGKVDDSTLVKVARSALCIAVPSHYEGFGLPALEAQALGAPVVASNASSLPEVVGDGALLCDPREPGQFASAFDALLRDTRLRADLIAKGFENAGRYSWDLTAERTLQAFESILDTNLKAAGGGREAMNSATASIDGRSRTS